MAADAKTAGTEVGDKQPTKLERLRARYPWLDHLVRSAERYKQSHGDHYAAAITYFSVLALVPLLMIAFAAAAFVLRAQPDLLRQLQDGITSAVPGPLGGTLNSVVETAIGQAGAVGVLGLLGALYSGVGWMSNLREALSEQWAQAEQPSNAVKKLVFDLIALVGLGLSLVVAFAVTAVGTGLGRTLLELVGLGDQGWAQFLLGLAGVVLGLVANWLVFLWVIARLPRAPVSARSALKAALLGAIGFEILKQIMTIYLRTVTASPAGAAFGSIIGLLIFVFFVSRFLLFVTAWAATARENELPQRAEVPGPAVIRPEVVTHSGPDGRTAAGLVGAGVVMGLLGMRFFSDAAHRR
ncbi:inner membrane protein YhjD [Pseudonocardia asaccharolytica]|uniref:Inner membrane protein YhjD n=1 Tax=Pseudonocardia asaccharolytica DSM 44247 = NBRC 16224 TaxID=1123024 RepID=A0A511CUC2_9PSEU|nr:inner membrane protein YhjD [Pseudonocardia asaccharolytica]GEL16182.1 inner membrane protein YhjD [Pseudonocardia asaccharolytica DSM 44247 = NBRC 16224]